MTTYCTTCKSRICPHNWRGVFLIVLLLVVPSEVLAYRGPAWPISVNNGRSIIGSASAVPVARRTSPLRTVFVTAKHNFRGASGGFVSDAAGDDWIALTAIQKSPTDDVACFEAIGDGWPIVRLVEDISDVPNNAELTLCGFGDSADSAKCCFDADYRKHTLASGYAVRSDNGHVIPGDSGGAVTAETNGHIVLVGIITAFTRDDNGHRDSRFVTANVCREFLTQRYGSPPVCTPWGCPPPQNYQRYQKIEPRLFAPPRVEFFEQSTPPTQNQAPPIEVDSELIESLVKQEIARLWQANKQHLRGERGPAGRDGSDGTQITVDQVAQYLIANYRDELKGERGPAGMDGSPGARGPAGPITTYDDQQLIDLLADSPRVQQILARLQQLEERKRRVLLVEDGNVLDDESYGLDEPIVLDLQRIVKSGQ